jgi:hypothetical protein
LRNISLVLENTNGEAMVVKGTHGIVLTVIQCLRGEFVSGIGWINQANLFGLL